LRARAIEALDHGVGSPQPAMTKLEGICKRIDARVWADHESGQEEPDGPAACELDEGNKL
jgi:hypothetical protein